MAQGLVSGGRLVEREAARDQVAVVDDAASGQVDNRGQILASTSAVGAKDRLRATHGTVNLNLGSLTAGTQADRHHAATVGENVERGVPREGNTQGLEGDIDAAAVRQLEDIFARILWVMELIVAVAPKALTASSLSSATSMAMTGEVPNARAIWTMLKPTPPTATWEAPASRTRMRRPEKAHPAR